MVIFFLLILLVRVWFVANLDILPRLKTVAFSPGYCNDFCFAFRTINVTSITTTPEKNWITWQYKPLFFLITAKPSEHSACFKLFYKNQNNTYENHPNYRQYKNHCYFRNSANFNRIFLLDFCKFFFIKFFI